MRYFNRFHLGLNWYVSDTLDNGFYRWFENEFWVESAFYLLLFVWNDGLANVRFLPHDELLDGGSGVVVGVVTSIPCYF